MILPAVALTASGRPRLAPGEVEHDRLSKVDIQFEESGGTASCTASKHEDGSAVLTSQRLIWIDTARAPSPGASCYIPLHCIESLEVRATKRWSTSKMRLRVHLDHHRQPISRQSHVSQVKEVKLVSRHYGSFSDKAQILIFQASETAASPQQAIPQAWSNPVSGQSNTFHHSQPPAQALAGWLDPVQPQTRFPAQQPYLNPSLMQQLTGMGFSRNRAAHACLATNNAGADIALQWLFEREGDYSLEAPPPGMEPSSQSSAPLHAGVTSPERRAVGVAGILKREQEIAAKNERTMEEAFQDLHGLMTKAQEMVQLAEKFKETLTAKGDSSQTDMDPEMQQQLIEIGIASPVTKELAGAQYHKQLSRQLAEFLEPRLGRAGGIMTLADVYCLFNRARGTELISPDDLLQAASLFTKWQASMRLRQFASGVTVIESNLHSDDEVCSRIAALVSGEGCGPPVSATAVSEALSIPLTIASQHLSMAESKGVVCRDDGPEGLRFFRNFFEEVAC